MDYINNGSWSPLAQDVLKRSPQQFFLEQGDNRFLYAWYVCGRLDFGLNVLENCYHSKTDVGLVKVMWRSLRM